jgi:hypothetical protein
MCRFCFSPIFAKIDLSIPTKRISIFIDGGNFHHLAIKKIGITENEFDFEAFVAFLTENNTIAENGKRFYIGTVREKEGDEASKKSIRNSNAWWKDSL